MSSPDLRTRAASPVPITPPDVEGARLRKRSLIWAGLLVPATLLAGVLVLATEAEARSTVHNWMDDELAEPPMSARSHERVEHLLSRTLDRGSVYRLDGPKNVERDLWSYSGVSTTNFHEFVAIDRARESMHLVVASDD